jgi:7-carboxy-7-deazaguanine synthase
LSPTLSVNEIFFSIQGESTHAGRPCVFVRLSGCDLRCTYCDTQYAYHDGRNMRLEEILRKVESFNCPLVEITGGEPLLQANVLPLMTQLADNGLEVLLETGGHRDIARVDPRVQRIMDIKCPSSGQAHANRLENIAHLRATDQIKFVVGDRADYEFAKELMAAHRLSERCTVLVSPVFGQMDSRQLAQWILDDHLPVRMHLQMHKYIWPPHMRGV